MYTFIVKWSEEDMCYLATVEEHPMLITHSHKASLALEGLEDLLEELDD